MRVSSDPADSGYTPCMHQFRVWLAGAERSNVLTADDTKRYAVQLARDEFGRPVLDKDGNQRRQEYYGDVRIERSPCDEQEDEMGALGAAIYGLIVSQP
jgi:3-dehydroquinate synthase class II